MYRSLILLVLIGTAFRLPLVPHAAGVAGTWKRTSMTLVDASGKTTDLNATMAKAMPCTKDITYTFLADGSLKTNVPDACGAMKKTIETMNASGKWTMSGQKLTVTTTIKSLPPATYDVRFQGNTMTWVFTYADNPGTPNPTNAKQMTIVYQQV